MAKKKKKKSSKPTKGSINLDMTAKIVQTTYEKKLESKKLDEVETVSDASLVNLNYIPSFKPVVWKSNFSFLKIYDPVFFSLSLRLKSFIGLTQMQHLLKFDNLQRLWQKILRLN